MNYTITYKDIEEILKDYGRTKGHVWLTLTTSNDCGRFAKKVDLKYDTTRRYFMSQIHQAYEEYHKNIALQRVPQDVFQNNVEYLLSQGYTISF